MLVKENIESIFPCNEMQQAFYLLSLSSIDDPGVIVAEAELAGFLDRELFCEAWNLELSRHEALRMSVRVKSDQTPMLVVWKQLYQEVEFVDEWTDGWLEQTSTLLREQIRLSAPPVSRIIVCTQSPEHHKLLWAFHHLLLDGWSTSVILRDVIARYHALLNSDSRFFASAKPTYSEYFRAREKADFWAAREYWQQELDGFVGNRPVTDARRQEDIQAKARTTSVCRSLPIGLTSHIQNRIRRSGLTAGVVATGCWSVLMHQLLESDDVAIGVTVSGRSTPVDGIQHLAGLMANVIPFRSRLDNSLTVESWLKTIRDHQFRSRQHDFLGLSEIHEICETSGSKTLFDSLLVVENFVQFQTAPEDRLQLQRFSSGATSSFPITCYVVPGKSWEIRVDVDRQVNRGGELVEKLSTGMMSLLEDFAKLDDPQIVQWFDKIDLPAIGPSIDTSDGLVEDIIQVQYSETELRLASIWESVLGVADVKPGDNFFDLGGKSISAVRICSRVEEEFNQKLSPNAFVEYPVLRKFAARLSTGEESNSEIIHFNRPDNARDLIVCVHAGIGYASYYRHLAKHLRSIHTLGVQSKGLDDGKPADTFEDLADHIGNQMQGLADGKNVHLVGYCMGGVFMFELARELQERQIDISNLFVVDAGPFWNLAPESFSEFVDCKGSVAKGAMHYLTRSMRRKLRQIRDEMQFHAAKKSNDRQAIHNHHHEQVRRATIRAYRRYELKHTDVPVRMIRSNYYASMQEKDHHERWRDFASDFKCCVVDGIHESLMLEPAVANVAEAILSVVDAESHSANSTIWRN